MQDYGEKLIVSMEKLSGYTTIQIGGGGWMNHLIIYIVITFFHFLISAANCAVAPGCSGKVNAAD